ncbi:MAG: response regulator transcription factor [Cyanobacteria bacterium SBLK]|nr:response regulator transcription factor [Cyanobacteria bacterium SBLK]
MTNPIIETTQTISILLVDDEGQFRQGLRTLLDFYSDRGRVRFEVIGEAENLSEMLVLLEQKHPTLIFLDLELSENKAENNGIDALIGLQELSYEGKVLVLSSHQDESWIFRAMQGGAKGYVFKDCLAEQLYEAILTILDDKIYLAPEVATRFFRQFQVYAGHSLPIAKSLKLTEREQEVLHWLVQGASNDAIAKKLYVTVATVKAHLSSIFTKLEVKNRTQAIVRAIRLGLVQA